MATEVRAPALVFQPKPSLPPPPFTVGPVAWVRANLFSGPVNTLLTLASAWGLYLTLAAFLEWAWFDAVFEANSRRECLDRSPTGACWAGVRANWGRLIYGPYPLAERWRIDFAFLALIAWMAPLWIRAVTGKIAIAATIVCAYPFFAGYMFLGGAREETMTVLFPASVLAGLGVLVHSACCILAGRSLPELLLRPFGDGITDKSRTRILAGIGVAAYALAFAACWTFVLPEVKTDRWGGLFLTLVISGIGITSALPSGILLALGRRSTMPLIRILCVCYIELIRSVPLITILFMAKTMFPLFMPQHIVVDELVRAIVAVCLFAAAYMAEIVRGGLQALPKGQYEAAAAVGLNYWQTTLFIVMPQALKAMIPNIVSNFIGLFKDTTLVAIIGLKDLMLQVDSAGKDRDWLGLFREPYFAATAIYFFFCYCMSKYSLHLERKLSAGNRR
ncbi:MAG: amino acid ABC transporter permease [Alphaproteobacteria bacterium]|jgi:general L-amino acid transport system permease protein